MSTPETGGAVRISAQEVIGAMLDAKSVVVVGASDDGTKASGRTIRYLLKYGFAGNIHAVNPRRETVQGLPAHSRVADLPEVPDLAVIVLPQSAVEQAVRDCGEHGIHFAVVFASGYGETGADGAELERSLARVARESGVRILGPNSVGAVSAGNALTAAFMTGLDQERFDLVDDGIAFVSQSGAMGGFILNLAQTEGLGVGRFLSTGNEADLELGELVEGIVTEGSTTSVLAYVEGIRDGAAFTRALEAARTRDVPVCVMKVGRSERGAAAAASHTGALAGSDTVFDGLLRRFGAPRAADVEELLDLGRVFSSGRRSRGNRVSVVTLSGGAGVLMTDCAEDLGLDVFEWSADQQAAMAAILPAFASVRNPIDTTGAIASDPGMLTDALRLCVENPDTDIAVILLGNLEAEEADICARIEEVVASTAKPVLVAWVGGSGNPRRLLGAAGIPTFGEPVRAMRAAAALVRWSQGRMPEPVAAPEVPSTVAAALARAAEDGTVLLDEVESKRVIAAAGIETPREITAGDEDCAVRAADEIGYPVVVKLLSDEVEHKSDIGGVRLDLGDAAAVREAAAEVLALAGRLGLARREVVVAEHVTRGAELILGASTDPTFGTVTMVGAGGIFTEVLKDVQVRPAPVDPGEAGLMIGQLAAVELLRGARGLPVADEADLARVVSSFSALAAALADSVESIDVNPLVICADGRPVALDAVVRLAGRA